MARTPVDAVPLPRIVSLIGYAGVGKDTLGSVLTNLEEPVYVRCCLADHIKRFYSGVLLLQETPGVTVSRIMRSREAFSKLDSHLELPDNLHTDDRASLEEQIEMLFAVLSEHVKAGKPIDPFTEDRKLKPLIREVLQTGGLLVYPEMLHRYRAQVTSLLAADKNVVNTRLTYPAELEVLNSYGVSHVPMHVISRSDNTKAYPIEDFWNNAAVSNLNWEMNAREMLGDYMEERDQSSVMLVFDPNKFREDIAYESKIAESFLSKLSAETQCLYRKAGVID